MTRLDRIESVIRAGAPLADEDLGLLLEAAMAAISAVRNAEKWHQEWEPEGYSCPVIPNEDWRNLIEAVDNFQEPA